MADNGLARGSLTAQHRACKFVSLTTPGPAKVETCFQDHIYMLRA